MSWRGSRNIPVVRGKQRAIYRQMPNPNTPCILLIENIKSLTKVSQWITFYL